MPAPDHFIQDLLAIVAAASIIPERLESGLIPDDTDANDDVVHARLDTWCQISSGGDWEQFRKRLARDGLDLNTAPHVLGPVRLNTDMPLPSWVGILREVLNFTDNMPDDEAEDRLIVEKQWHGLDSNPRVPFGEVIAPFVTVARQKLINRSGAAFHLLSDEAHLTLQRDLLRSLVSCAVDTLLLEFSNERAQVQEDERAYYQQFIRQMRSAHLAAFFRKYSVLARLLATLTEQWIAATVAFLQRLATDWSAIQHMLGDNDEQDQVMAVQPSLSRPHDGRRCVMALTFASGRKVIYKPRNIGLEEAYYRLLAWCNEQGIPLPSKVLTCINRSNYGWVEYVEQQACQYQQEVHRYYLRAGMLLCLVYILGGMDCLAEHIIANGEHPVLIDAGILMHPYPFLSDPDNRGPAPLGANEHLVYSVLHTGLLSTWQSRKDRRSIIDVSGLGAIGMATATLQQEHTHANLVAKKNHEGANIPILNGLPQWLEDYAEDVIKGFQLLSCFLLNHREALLADNSPLYGLEHQQVRFIFRPTWTYQAMKEKLLTPAFLRDGVDQSIQLELLGQTVIPFEHQLWGRGEKTRWWPILAAEQQALVQGDIPLFTAHASNTALIIGTNQEIEGCFQEPGFALVVKRLKELSDKHLLQQVKLIQASLYAPAVGGGAPLSAVNNADVAAYLTSEPLLTTKELETQALIIAEQIARRAIQMTDGSVSWLAACYLSRSERYQLRPMGYDLFKGTCGVILFLAALEKITGGAGYRPLILGAVQSVIQALKDTRHHLAEEMGIGGAIGLGSVIYTLTRISQFLDEPALLADARQAAREITAESVASDKALDIIAGAAGAILGLMALYDVSPEQDILERAMLCGQHLLQTQTVNETGYRAWPTLGGKCTTGFSHGAAGIAYALLRLYAATQNADVLEAAREGIAYEDSLLLPEAGNWPELPLQQPPFMPTWCHGAPGIGLARVGGLSIRDTAQIRQDIDCALQTTQQCKVQGSDHLCCGNLGRADVLLTASISLLRPDLSAAARRTAWQVLSRAQQRGSFALNNPLPRWMQSLDFFQGMAGIGYEFLRIAYPNQLPSVLLWQ